MDKKTLLITFICGSIYFIYYKFFIINSYIYSALRQQHSKSYLKKQKNNFANKIFFLNYKNEISKARYYLNFTFVVMILLNIIFAVVSLINSDLLIIKIYLYVFFAVLCFSVLIELIRISWSIVKSKNILIRIFIVAFYIAVTILTAMRFLRI